MDHSDGQTTRSISRGPCPHIMPWNIDDTLCDIIGCYGYDVNIVAAVAQAANDKDGSSAIGSSMYLCTYTCLCIYVCAERAGSVR